VPRFYQNDLAMKNTADVTSGGNRRHMIAVSDMSVFNLFACYDDEVKTTITYYVI
jgi:hypothetical protein